MKNSIQQLGRFSVLLLVAHSGAVAQVIKSPRSDAQRVELKKGSKTEQEQREREQLKMLRTSTLTRTLDSIKKIDEPALRISARNVLLKYLTLDGALSEENKHVSAGLTHDSLADFSEHFEKIMPSLADSLFSNFATWVNKYQPTLSEKVEILEATKMKGKDFQSIRSLMGLPGGDVLAAQRITQYLEDGKDVPVLILYLNDLIVRNSPEVTPLLSKIVDVAAQGRLSFETLLSVSDLYLQPQTPLALKQRFLRTVVARTQPFNLDQETTSQSAFYLLTNLLPVIKQVLPELYQQAVNQRLVIYAAFNKDQLADEQRSKRLSESSSPVEDLMTEADQTKSKLKRNQLLAHAAQLALVGNTFPLCLEAIDRLDLEAPGMSADFWKNWNDQFVRHFVKKVLEEKKPELAEQATEHANGPYARVQSLAMIIQYWMKAANTSNARRLLTQAQKVAGNATDYVERAKAFLLLSALTTNKTDSSERVELLEAAVKALNSVALPERGDDLRPYQTYVWKLNGAEYQVTTQFKELTETGREEALTLVERIDKPESRTFALLGILHGMRQLSVATRD